MFKSEVGPSVIVKRNIDSHYIRAAFSLSVLFGLGFGLLVFALAPFVEKVFQINELARILRTLCIIFPLKGVSVVAESLLKKNMSFKVLAYRGLFSYALGYGGIGIILAFSGFGVWALVGAKISQVLINSVFVLIAFPHPKALLFRKDLSKELFFYGGGFTLSRFFSYTANEADNFIVARWMGTSALGFYSKAYTLLKTPVNLYGQMMHEVLFPALAGIRDKSDQLTSALANGTVVLSVISMPLMLLMLVLAPEIILFFLGDQWIKAIAPFQIFAASMYFRVGYRISVTIAKSSAVIYKNAYLQMVYTALIITAAFVGKNWGVNGVATGVTLAIFVQFMLMSNLGISITNLTWKRFLYLHLPALLYTALLCPFVLGITYVARVNDISNLGVLVFNFTAVSIVTLVLLKFKMYQFLGEEIGTIFQKVNSIIMKKLFKSRKKNIINEQNKTI